MATHRKNVPEPIKRQLRNEAGGKCANPGCFNRRVEFHHIKQWHVYKSHDEKEMIAVCPACHDAIHHGSIKITDTTLYRWKSLVTNAVGHDHLQLDPAKQVAIVAGGTLLTVQSGAGMVYDMSPGNALGFALDEQDFALYDFRLTACSGMLLMRMKHNRLTHSVHPDVQYERVPGLFRLTLPDDTRYLPNWLEAAMANYTVVNPELPSLNKCDIMVDGRLLAAEMEVVSPGILRYRGYCVDGDCAFVVTNKLILTAGRPNKWAAFSGDGFLNLGNNRADSTIFTFESQSHYWKSRPGRLAMLSAMW